MKLLLILNDAPYGIERTYNGLRIAGALAKHADAELRIFLMGDAVITSVNGQKVPAGLLSLLWSPTKCCGIRKLN